MHLFRESHYVKCNSNTTRSRNARLCYIRARESAIYPPTSVTAVAAWSREARKQTKNDFQTVEHVPAKKDHHVPTAASIVYNVSYNALASLNLGSLEIIDLHFFLRFI
jgi:hypothetical protein